MYAIEGSHTETVREILAQSRFTDYPDNNGNTALIYAFENGNTEIINLLLQEERIDLDDKLEHVTKKGENQQIDVTEKIRLSEKISDENKQKYIELITAEKIRRQEEKEEEKDSDFVV
jgi:ankyrin repeat protein